MGWYRYIFVDILKMIEDGCMIHQDKIEPLHKIGVHIWEKGLANTFLSSPKRFHPEHKYNYQV